MQIFTLVNHTADLQMHVVGGCLHELFAHALQGMTSLMKPEAKSCHYQGIRVFCDTLPEAYEITVKSVDREGLLVDFLAEVLYLSLIQRTAYLALTIKQLNDTVIAATLHGVRVFEFGREIKAVTYHDVHIKHHDAHWEVDLVFDV